MERGDIYLVPLDPASGRKQQAAAPCSLSRAVRSTA
jgi:mRNA-degrading endonuclease toxin of MazEF toxin-antitoxin module